MQINSEKVVYEITPTSSSDTRLMETFYGKLAAFKHIVFACADLCNEPEALALIFSEQIREKLHDDYHAIWLLKNERHLVKIAENGILTPSTESGREDFRISETIEHLIKDKNVIFRDDIAKCFDLFNRFHSPLVYPFRQGNHIFGLLVLDNIDPTSVDDTFRFVAQLAGLLFNMMHLFRKGERQKNALREMNDILMQQQMHMSDLHHIGLQIMGSRDQKHLFQIVTRNAVRKFKAKRAAGFIISSNERYLTQIAAYGGFDSIDTTIDITEQNIFRQSMASGRIISFAQHGGILKIGLERLQNWVIFPLKGSRETLGFMVIEIADLELSDPLAILANNAGMMLENFINIERMKDFNRELIFKTRELEQINKKLEHISITDTLTRLYNHRYFQVAFEMEFIRARQYGTKLSMVMADIDFFKRVNDQYGHAAGDRVLEAVAMVLKENCRVTDIVARYGGEEFAVVLPHADLKMATVMAERIRKAIWQQHVAFDDKSIRVSISLGVATLPPSGITSQTALFDRADQALYRAKQKGRNRVEIDESEPSQISGKNR